ncbi:hypothetical protein BGZ49_003479 [Haplosporangium sp. Z 27]|nr:hypothetical protein BGZ49_003479 [Haplosporangium sp. Z 27]
MTSLLKVISPFQTQQHITKYEETNSGFPTEQMIENRESKIPKLILPQSTPTSSALPISVPNSKTKPKRNKKKGVVSSDLSGHESGVDNSNLDDLQPSPNTEQSTLAAPTPAPKNKTKFKQNYKKKSVASSGLTECESGVEKGDMADLHPSPNTEQSALTLSPPIIVPKNKAQSKRQHKRVVSIDLSGCESGADNSNPDGLQASRNTEQPTLAPPIPISKNRRRRKSDVSTDPSGCESGRDSRNLDDLHTSPNTGQSTLAIPIPIPKNKTKSRRRNKRVVSTDLSGYESGIDNSNLDDLQASPNTEQPLKLDVNAPSGNIKRLVVPSILFPSPPDLTYSQFDEESMSDAFTGISLDPIDPLYREYSGSSCGEIYGSSYESVSDISQSSYCSSAEGSPPRYRNNHLSVRKDSFSAQSSDEESIEASTSEQSVAVEPRQFLSPYPEHAPASNQPLRPKKQRCKKKKSSQKKNQSKYPQNRSKKQVLFLTYVEDINKIPKDVNYWNDDKHFIIKDRYPKSSVHLLVLPRKTIEKLDDLSGEEGIAVVEGLRDCANWLIDTSPERAIQLIRDHSTIKLTEEEKEHYRMLRDGPLKCNQCQFTKPMDFLDFKKHLAMHMSVRLMCGSKEL